MCIGTADDTAFITSHVGFVELSCDKRINREKANSWYSANSSSLNDRKTVNRSPGYWNYYKSLENLINRSVELEKNLFAAPCVLSGQNWTLSNLDIAFKGSKNNFWMPDHLRNADDYCTFLLYRPTKNFRPDPLLLDKYLQSPKVALRLEFSFVGVSKARGQDIISLNFICYSMPVLLPTIKHIIMNVWPSSGYFPNSWKRAILTQIPKSDTLIEAHKDLKPISVFFFTFTG